ncbi:mRNA cap guanine-N7 methyltransferase-like [Episyrphus balteatus]|uniref:mRNA cap guanine-N7 methyltransferase-like n=1 Tax=Episyrphus balteatus TaxID=286459 RepID=UPI00248511C7|nr:mRNA cap guanine-N7 methyltransferase-like [Episyrphus balteatus]
MHFLTNFLRPKIVFTKLCTPKLVKQEIIKKYDFLNRVNFHINYLIILELVNSLSQQKKSITNSLTSCHELPTSCFANVETKETTPESREHSKLPLQKIIIKPGKRNQSKIYHLRNLNNWIKNMLIIEYITKIREHHPSSGDSLRVLEMCCGKGGDLLKYSKQNIAHLICTDIAEISLNQCKKRYYRLAQSCQSCFSAEFFLSDCSRDRLRAQYKSPWLEHHLVSCQFALHFSFESYQQADCMIRNASECLQSGGFFIATIPNANEIMRRLRESSDGRSFGNEYYNLQFLSDTQPPPIFGAKYLFQLEGVVDCLEFLVHFPTLVKLCRKHGLQLDKVNSFSEYFEASSKRGENLLRKTECLQTVYIEKDSKIEENFSHIENFANENQCWSNNYGTLSKPEWEIATLYLVCAFRKCDNTWDDELNPIYNFDS